MEKENGNLPETIVLAPMRAPLGSVVTMPGSKSIANRLLLMAGMAGGTSTLSGVPGGDDSRSALAALTSLGIGHEPLEEGVHRVHGCGHAIPRSGVVDIGSAGTVGRFLPGLLASAEKGAWRLVSSEQLARRPIAPLVDRLRDWGADIAYEREGLSFPLAINAGGLSGGPAAVSAATSTQFASGLLLAGPYARTGAVVDIVDLDPDDRYIDTTVECMRRFGADLDCSPPGEKRTVAIRPGGYRAADMTVEADLNSALVFLAMPLLLGGTMTVANVPAGTRQTGAPMLDVFRRLGATVAVGAPGASVSAEAGGMRGGFDIDMRSMAESALLLAVLAVFADKPVTMTNLSHIRNHETDRLKAVGEIMAQIGVRVDEVGDGIRIHPRAKESIRSAEIDSRGDHRIVTAFSLLGLAANGLTIRNAAAVSKTFPGFFRLLRSVGGVTKGVL
ncbi:MAG: 3-phosphoshikimate 1-carboxyvinyltransferase [Planctomycetota bacterium]|jgi:3-phosphoshikimate 1-carboxyvinyltransferase|nr:3-phosphoshikimate 1-carboxyvinyltransferase [Planctomycetota bacterium]